MDCAEFLAIYSDIADGTAAGDRLDAAEAHASTCASCRRYRDVLHAGTKLLRSLPAPELAHDFHPRLQHRLFHAADARRDAPGDGSATPPLTVLGMALLITVVAWSPIFGRDPVVELEPIVVSRPAPVRPTRPANALPGLLQPVRAASGLDGGLWDDPRALLYEYSPLSQRYRRASPLRRTGLDQTR